ncbi:MAG: xanthine dehydrogenase molybdopterin binding subunit, partial [Methylocella sp.]
MATARRKPIETDAVGLALAHDSAALHVAGAATYIDDMLEPEGLLHIYPGYAAEAALGRIASINLDAVRKFPGVVAVLTASDI